MQCSSCKKNLDFDDFSLNKHNIYYMRCNKCKQNEDPDFIKQRNKEYYEFTKKNNVINCNCGSQFIAFREYHVMRHINSKRHLEYKKN